MKMSCGEVDGNVRELRCNSEADKVTNHHRTGQHGTFITPVKTKRAL